MHGVVINERTRTEFTGATLTTQPWQIRQN